MKRMVKNGDLIDVEPDGSITVAGKPIGGGGSNERELTLTMPYASNDNTFIKRLYIDDEIYNNINNFYYESIKLYFNDGNPIGIFNVFHFTDKGGQVSDADGYACLAVNWPTSSSSTWYGSIKDYKSIAYIMLSSNDMGKFLRVVGQTKQAIPELTKSNFDALYKLADKPTQDGTYVLKATVSGGAVTYTWEQQA